MLPRSRTHLSTPALAKCLASTRTYLPFRPFPDPLARTRRCACHRREHAQHACTRVRTHARTIHRRTAGHDLEHCEERSVEVAEVLRRTVAEEVGAENRVHLAVDAAWTMRVRQRRRGQGRPGGLVERQTRGKTSKATGAIVRASTAATISSTKNALATGILPWCMPAPRPNHPIPHPFTHVHPVTSMSGYDGTSYLATSKISRITVRGNRAALAELRGLRAPRAAGCCRTHSAA
jgi:hypothetical protein